MTNWILPFQGRNPSEIYNLNFLWQRDNVYIMDNHRAAFWCWMQHFNPGNHAQLLHIDMHYDTRHDNIEEWMALCPDDGSISLESYLDLSYQVDDHNRIPLFAWDNFLSIFLEKYGDSITACYYATHQVGDKPRHKDLRLIEPWYLPENIPFWIGNSPQPSIVNIDLDYFVYKSSEDDVKTFFSDEYFTEVFKGIREQMDRGKILVLTLCLSPECTGGWESAERLCRHACNILGIEFMLAYPDAQHQDAEDGG